MQNIVKAAAFALLLPLIAACSGDSGSSDSSSSAEDTSAEDTSIQTEAATGESASDGITIGFPIPGPAPYVDGYLERWDALAAEEGVTTILTMGDWTPALQAEQIDAMIAQKPDVMVIWAVDNKAILPVLARIQEAGIPAIATNAFPEEESFAYLLGYTGPDDVAQGRKAGEVMVEALGGQGDVGMVRGTPGTAAHVNRWKGFEEAIAGSDVKVVLDQDGAWGDPVKTYEIVSAMLRQNPSLKGIYIQDDGTVEGAIQAIDEAGADVVLVGVNGTCVAQEAIKAGRLLATPFQNPWSDAEYALRAAQAVVRGESIPKVNHLDAPVITIDNVDSFDCYF